MSLVNDMLKDLDQRRRESDGGGARVKLTPASEFPKAAAKIKPAYIIGAMVVVAALLAATWIQLSSDSAPRSLDSRPSIAIPNEVARQTAEPVGVTPVSESIESEPVNSTSNEVSAAESTIRPQADILAQAVQQRDRQQPELAPLTPAVEETSAPVISDSTQLNIPSEDTGSDRALVDVRSGAGIDSSVKNEAVVSEDQQDTMAVQESLRLIANNNVTEAYANLENHIINNRYAHQSRETYAKLLVSEGQYQAAYNLIEQGLVLAPNHPGFKKVKARILIQNGQVLDAVDLLLARAPRVSEDVEYHEILASAQLATKDYAGAVISYSELVGANQTEGKFWYGYAASQELLGNVDVARQAYSRAVQQSSLSANLRRRSQDRLLALRE